jgi:hypothetical protein
MHSTQSGPQFGGWGATLAEHDYLLRPFIPQEMDFAEVDFYQLPPDSAAQFLFRNRRDLRPFSPYTTYWGVQGKW